ncbi:unnamed protein product [Brassica oleracea]|uniref:(rape) hypothetical protein n=1 Tax=Brassica napus TaxID=3708 RepID=A0A816UT94_BRANA|nr:unnamed protein product [Brassica napus]
MAKISARQRRSGEANPLPQELLDRAAAAASATAAASMRTVVVRFADADAAAAAAAYYIAIADFIGVSRRTRHSDAASDAVSCVNETNKS